MNYTTINVYSYIDPERIHRVNINAKWYLEGKVLESNYDNVIALKDGWKVRYKVMVYKFRRVKEGALPVEKLIKYIKMNPGKKYKGWMHHAQVYEKRKGQHYGSHKKYIPLNFEL